MGSKPSVRVTLNCTPAQARPELTMQNVALAVRVVAGPSLVSRWPLVSMGCIPRWRAWPSNGLACITLPARRPRRPRWTWWLAQRCYGPKRCVRMYACGPVGMIMPWCPYVYARMHRAVRILMLTVTSFAFNRVVVAPGLVGPTAVEPPCLGAAAARRAHH